MKTVDLHQYLSDDAKKPRATTLLQEKGLRAVLLHLAGGEQIPEHQARGAITVQCLKGNGAFSLPEERIDLRPGLLISVPPGTPHSVTAQSDTTLLVTLSEPVPAL
jgi:quercetin dioxygenase-like cupin family protein